MKRSKTATMGKLLKMQHEQLVKNYREFCRDLVTDDQEVEKFPYDGFEPAIIELLGSALDFALEELGAIANPENQDTYVEGMDKVWSELSEIQETVDEILEGEGM